jgi:hypothetical protein
MKNWLCSGCFEVIQSERQPSNSNDCRNGKFHVWRDLGECGDDIYKCSKCDVKVHSKRTPVNGNSCINGGQHNWAILQRAPSKTNNQPEKITNSDRNTNPQKISSHIVEEEPQKRKYDDEHRHHRSDDEILEEVLAREERRPCDFCGKSGGVKSYLDYHAHKECMNEFLGKPEAKDYIAKVIKKEEEFKQCQAEQKRKYEEEEKERKRKEEEELRITKQEAIKFTKKKRIRQLLRFIIIPTLIVVIIEFVLHIGLFITLNSTGRLIGIGIEYFGFIGLSFFMENKFDIDYYPDSSLLKPIILNILGYAVAFSLLKFIIAISL